MTKMNSQFNPGVVLIIITLAVLSRSQEEDQEATLDTRVYARFGDGCGEELPCDRDANLACQNAVCDCLMPQLMLYDEEALECRVKAGERCKFNTVATAAAAEEEGTTGAEDERVVVMPCTSNSTCGVGDGLCRCNPYFYKDARGRCQEKKTLGMGCERTVECDTGSGLVCWDGRCGCNPSVSRPPLAGSGPRNTCVGIPGGPCIHATCELNSECRGGRCVCEDGFQLDYAQRRCRGLFDEPCADGSFCGLEYDCVDSRCKCRGPNQVFDDVLQRCLSIVGEACSRDEDCVPHAACTPRAPIVVGSFCQCRPGFVEFGPGFCRNGYGSPCLHRTEERSYLVEKDSLLASSLTDLVRWVKPVTENVQRRDSLVLIKVGVRGCDENRKLRCRKGRCSCKDGVETYSERWGKCVGLAGTLCSVYETHGCVDRADCAPVLNLKHIGLGRCTCRDDFVLGPQRLCTERGSNEIPVGL